jgi:hypothetical protein
MLSQINNNNANGVIIVVSVTIMIVKGSGVEGRRIKAGLLKGF